MAVAATRMKKQEGGLPRWAVLAVLGLLAIALLAAFGGVREQQAFLKRETQRQRTIISQSLAQMDALDAQLAEVGDEARIRRIASNRMGMHPPTAEQVYPIPAPQVMQAKEDGLPSTDGIGLVDMIRGARGN